MLKERPMFTVCCMILYAAITSYAVACISVIIFPVIRCKLLLHSVSYVLQSVSVQCGCLPGPLRDTSNCLQFCCCGIRSRGRLDSGFSTHVDSAWIVVLMSEARNRGGYSIEFLVSD